MGTVEGEGVPPTYNEGLNVNILEGYECSTHDEGGDDDDINKIGVSPTGLPHSTAMEMLSSCLKENRSNTTSPFINKNDCPFVRNPLGVRFP